MQSVDAAVTDPASATKKFFRRVLPIMLVMLVCNQLNRSNIGYAPTDLSGSSTCLHTPSWKNTPSR